MGATFVNFLAAESAAKTADVVRAYTLARQIFDLESLWDQVDALDAQIPSALQLDLLSKLMSIAKRASRWMLRMRDKGVDLPTLITRYQPSADLLRTRLDDWLPERAKEVWRQTSQEWTEWGVSAELARQLTSLEFTFPALDLVDLGATANQPLEQTARAYFEVEVRLDLSGWRAQINRLPTDTLWQTQARGSARDDVYAIASQITQTVLTRHVSLDDWAGQHAAQISRLNQLLQTISAQATDLAPVSVALRELRHLA
jgi:glutamate dehydrogenase